MTRIRKNWSSSRVSKEPVAVSSQSAAPRDSQALDLDEKPASTPPNEDAIHLLASVSVEHFSDEADVKRETSSAIVVPTGSMDAKEREPGSGTTNAKFVKSNGSTGQRKKSVNSYEKMSRLSDQKPASLANASKRELEDKEGSKSSSVSESEATQDPAAVEPPSQRGPNILESHSVDREPANENTSRVLQELGTGKKKRQRLWETAKGPDSPESDRKKPKVPSTGGRKVSGANKRKPKPHRAPMYTPEPKKKLMYKKFGEEKSGRDDDDDSKSFDDSDSADSSEDDDLNNSDGDTYSDKVVKDKKKPATKSKRVAAYGSNKGTSNPKSGKANKKHAVPIETGRKRRAKSQSTGSDDGERKNLRAKPAKSEGDEEAAGPEDTFPKGWKYKGLAQIAERDEVPGGQAKKLCGRTDGHNWRCPLRVVEGLSLCQHHLNKARAKKLGRSSQQKKQVDKKANEPPPAPAQSLDTSAQKQAPPTDQNGPKFRRRHKTAKLSGL